VTVPTDFPNLFAWITGDGGFVDLSGNGNNPTLPGGANNPTLVAGAVNGHTAIDFAAASLQKFSLPSLTSFAAGEVFVVIKVNASPAPSAAKSGLFHLGSGASGTDAAFPFTDGKIYGEFGTTSFTSEGTPVAPLTSWQIYNVSSSSAGYLSTLSGAIQFARTTNPLGWASAPTVGEGLASNGRYLDGRIAEFVLYSAVMADADRAALLNALAAKYAIALSPATARFTAISASVPAVDIATPLPKARLTALSASVLALDIGNPPQVGARFTSLSLSAVAVDVTNPPRSAPYSYAMVIS